MFTRILEKTILSEIGQREITIVNGPRRIGKTTLLHTLEKKIKGKKRAYFDFTDPQVIKIWKDYGEARINSILNELGMDKGGVIFFDEVQYFDKVGILLKLFYDHFPKVKIIATGSSSFLFLQNIGDSLTGRKRIYLLYPLSISEITGIETHDYWSFAERPVQAALLQETVRKILVFGSYPEIFITEETKRKEDRLKEIVDSLLFKDILMIEGIKKPRLMVELAKLLAYQIGNLVNPNEIAGTLGISRDTVLNYIDLLERFFIVFRLPPFEKNMRDTIRKKFKVYFFDLGIRNALIGNFSPLETREDKGNLLENAIALGLKRRIDYDKKLSSLHFWRNYDGKEIDIVVSGREVFGVEVKWNKKNHKISKSFKGKGMIVDFPDSYRFMF